MQIEVWEAGFFYAATQGRLRIEDLRYWFYDCLFMEGLPKISVRRKVHEDRICLFFFFDLCEEFVADLQDISALWSKTYSAWYLFEESLSLHDVFATFRESAIVDITDLETIESFMPISRYIPTVCKISEAKRDIAAINKEKEYAISNFVLYLKARGYRPSTIRSFKYPIKKFLFSFNSGIDDITVQQINEHCASLMRHGRVSPAVSQFMRSLHHFQSYWEEKILFVNGREYHRKERKYLPFVPSDVLKAICSYLVKAGVN